MTETNQKIDTYFRRDRWKQIRATAFLLPFIAVFLWFLAPNAGPTVEVDGLVIKMIGRPSDEGDRLYLRVRLADNTEVRVPIKFSTQFRPGGRVRLLAQKPLTIGKTVYRFNGYGPAEQTGAGPGDSP